MSLPRADLDWLLERSDSFSDRSIGATYPGKPAPCPPLVRDPLPEGEQVELQRRKHTGRTYSDVAYGRRSRRSADKPPRVKDLSRLLEPLLFTATDEAGEYPSAQAIVPSGGGMHGIDVWIVVERVQGLTSGLWWLDRSTGRVTRVAPLGEPLRALLSDAASSAGSEPPPVLVVMTYRISRLFWKYEALPLPIALRDVGAAYALLGLACSEWGLAGTPLGSVCPKTFMLASGRPVGDEPALGAFSLYGRIA